MAHVRRALHGCQRAEWAHFVRWATCRYQLYYVFLLSGSSKREAAATSSTSTTLCARAASAGARNFLRICRPRAVGFEAPRTPQRSWRTPCTPWPLTRMLDRLANDCRCFAERSGNGGRKPFAAMSLCKDLQPLWLSWLTKSSRWPQRAAARSSQVCGVLGFVNVERRAVTAEHAVDLWVTARSKSPRSSALTFPSCTAALRFLPARANGRAACFGHVEVGDTLTARDRKPTRGLAAERAQRRAQVAVLRGCSQGRKVEPWLRLRGQPLQELGESDRQARQSYDARSSAQPPLRHRMCRVARADLGRRSSEPSRVQT